MFMSPRGQVEALALFFGVSVCAAPGLGKLEAVGVTLGLACCAALFARARGAAAAPPAAAVVPEVWEQALRVEEAPADFAKFASYEDKPATPGKGDDDDGEVVAIRASAAAVEGDPKAFARPVHALSPAFAPPATPSRRASVAASSDLKRLLNDLGLARCEDKLTEWGAKTPEDLKFIDDDDFAQLGLSKAQGRLLQRKAADEP